jgi:hypothetical protein
MNTYWSYIARPHLMVDNAIHHNAKGHPVLVPVYAATFEPRGVKYRGLGRKDRERQERARASA